MKIDGKQISLGRESEILHVPVMLEEVVKLLDVRSNENYIDATLGSGGYTRVILEKCGPLGRVLGIDWDKAALLRTGQEFGKNVEVRSNKFQSENIYSRRNKTEPHRSDPNSLSERLVLAHGNFKHIEEIAHSNNFNKVAGVVFDLGFSSDVLERSGRGFSFVRDEPLIMTYETDRALSGGRTARDIINQSTGTELEGIIAEYGEEQRARGIARAIVEERKRSRIETTFDLVRAIDSVSRSVKTKARVFQALRIAVNSELENVRAGIVGAWNLIEENGVMVVVSFHSLEDKVVKNFFTQEYKQKRANLITKKPIRPSKEEVRVNSRSRSARLRAIRKEKNYGLN